MRIATWQSSTGSGPHVAQLERGLVALGHHVEPYRTGRGYDLVLMHSHVPHQADYRYPGFPEGSTPVAFVDFTEYGPFTRLPAVAEAYRHGLTETARSHDTKNRVEQDRLLRWLEGRSFPYFLREIHRCLEYGPAFHPIDYPLYHLSVDATPPNREEYLARDLELSCVWGHSHPWRKCIEEEHLRKAHRKAEIHAIDRGRNKWRLDCNGLWSEWNPTLEIWEYVSGRPSCVESVPVKRGYIYDKDGEIASLEQWVYFERMRAAKTTVSFDGYGSGSFRMTEALCRTLLLQGSLSIRQQAPIICGVTCREYQAWGNGKEFAGTNIESVLRLALEDAEGSYEIYERGFQHVHEHLTERATAAYLLDTVAAHDWSKPTELTV